MVQKNTLKIPFKQLKFENNLIGYGGSSIVSVGQFPDTDSLGNVNFQKCAFKRINVFQNIGEESIIQKFDPILKEILLLQKLNLQKHPNIIRLLGLSLDVEFILILEYCSQGNFKQILKQQKLSLESKIDKIIQIVEALKVLHQNKTAHLDIKPENVLIDQYGVVKLTDFGISKELKQLENNETISAFQEYGTPGFCSPEVYINKYKVTRYSDI